MSRAILQERGINQPGWRMPENWQQKISASKVLSNDVIHCLLKPPSRQSVMPPGPEPGKGRTVHVLPSQPPLPSSTPKLQPEVLYRENEAHIVFPGTASPALHLPNAQWTSTRKTQLGIKGNGLRRLMAKGRGLIATSWKAEENCEQSAAQYSMTSEDPQYSALFLCGQTLLSHIPFPSF